LNGFGGFSPLVLGEEVSGKKVEIDFSKRETCEIQGGLKRGKRMVDISHINHTLRLKTTRRA
jgi:hypothetical protein